MSINACLAALTIFITGCASVSGQRAPDEGRHESAPEPGRNGKEHPVVVEKAATPLDLTVQDMKGNDVLMSRYRGKVVMIVNVASKCGFTNQYGDLQRLHERYAADGLAILGFPANNFLWQEPGTNDRIMRFCSTTYGVTFDMFAKVSVKGRKQCDLYRWLTSKTANPAFGGEIKWNFTKFLLDRTGKVIGRFEPRTRPDDPAVISAIEAALGSPG